MNNISYSTYACHSDKDGNFLLTPVCLIGDPAPEVPNPAWDKAHFEERPIFSFEKRELKGQSGEMKYTPSPWKLMGDESNSILSSDGSRRICHIANGMMGLDEEGYGNQEIIRIAPEMYELLKQLKEACLDENDIRRSDWAYKIARLGI